MLKIIKFLLPLLLLSSGIAFIFAFEFYIKDRMNTVPVIVAATDISFKESFSTENLTVTHIKREQMVRGAYTAENELSNLIGQVAAIDISEGTQLYEALVDSYDLVPNEEAGEFIAPVPNDWIFAVPGSMRRSYLADFYMVSAEQSKELQNHFTEEHDKLLSNAQDQDAQDQDAQDQAPSSQIVLQPEQQHLKVIASMPVIKDIKIIHTKDSSNREVRNVQETQFDATANISNIEIIATQDVLNQLKYYSSQGYKFYITYKISR